MEGLASIFVSIVTLANTIVPGAELTKMLSVNPLSNTPGVLSSTSDLTQAGESAVVENSAALNKNGKVQERIQKYQLERQQKLQ